MIDNLSIGASPSGEDCAQVGTPDYFDKARAECNAFKHQLIRVFGEPPFGARLAVKSNPHDFGDYLEVVCYYDEENEDARNYAFNMESNTPERWDEISNSELRKVSVGRV